MEIVRKVKRSVFTLEDVNLFYEYYHHFWELKSRRTSFVAISVLDQLRDEINGL